MSRTDKQQLLVKVAELYYINQKSQSEIARDLGYSRSAISRLLAEAREEGVVEISINYPLQRSPTLQQSLRERFGLHETLILAKPGANPERNIRLVSKLAADYLINNLPENNILGVSWGATINEVVNQLRPLNRPDLKVVQIIGSIGHGDTRIDGNAFVYQIANLFRASCYTLNAPLIVEEQANRDLLVRDRSIRETLSLASRAGLILTGAGTMQHEHSTLCRAGYITPQELDEIAAAGGVGNICSMFYDINGRILDIDINRRVVGLSLSELANTRRRVAAVAAGEMKVRPLLGALRGGFVNVLITDIFTAESILKMDAETA